MDKVKEVVNKVVHPKSSDTTTTGTHSTTSSTHHSGATGTHGTAGPHQSNVANKADPRVDSDLDGSRNAGAAQYGTGAHNTNSGLTGSHASHNTAGPHSSDYANKADPRVDSDLDGSRNMGAAQYGGGASHSSGLTSGTTGTTGFGNSHTGSTNAGPHNSNLMNKADPRVDSDRDGKGFGAAHSTPGTTGYGSGTTGYGSGTTGYGSSTTGTSGLSSHSGSTNAGPHNSNLLNKADPRVDSDRDGKGFGAAHSTPGTTGYGSSTTGSSGLGSSHTTSGSTNAGPHNSNMLNKLDPRVDSDRDGKTNMGAAEYGSGAHHNTGSTNHGEHNSNLMNKADPRIDSDRDGSRNYGAAQSGPGAHHTTDSTNAGPHKSNILNKLDPRVDSDRDGSKTYGQQQY